MLHQVISRAQSIPPYLRKHVKKAGGAKPQAQERPRDSRFGSSTSPRVQHVSQLLHSRQKCPFKVRPERFSGTHVESVLRATVEMSRPVSILIVRADVGSSRRFSLPLLRWRYATVRACTKGALIFLNVLTLALQPGSAIQRSVRKKPTPPPMPRSLMSMSLEPCGLQGRAGKFASGLTRSHSVLRVSPSAGIWCSPFVQYLAVGHQLAYIPNPRTDPVGSMGHPVGAGYFIHYSRCSVSLRGPHHTPPRCY